MADDVRPDEDQAPPPAEAPTVEGPPPEAAAPPPAKQAAPPRLLRLEVQSDGTPDGTRLVDRDTGEELRLDGHVYAEVRGGPGLPGLAYVQAVFADVPVTTAGNVYHPFTLAGVVLGRSGAPPVAAQGGSPAAGLPGTGGARDHAAALAHNRALNQR